MRTFSLLIAPVILTNYLHSSIECFATDLAQARDPINSVYCLSLLQFSTQENIDWGVVTLSLDDVYFQDNIPTVFVFSLSFTLSNI